MSIKNQIIQVSRYQLIASADAFTKAIKALSDRTQNDGPRDILRYSFYVNAEVGSAGALIVYQDPAAWIGQHNFVTSVAEYQDFYKTVKLVGLQLFGKLSPEIRQWLDEREINYEYSGILAAGFVR